LKQTLQNYAAAVCALLLPACASVSAVQESGAAAGFEVKSFVFADTAFVKAYAVETENEIVVIDAGFSPAHSAQIKEYADKQSKPISRVLITHGHIDHYAGAYSLVPSVDRLVTSAGVAKQIKEYDAINYARFGLAAPAGPRVPGTILEDGDVIVMDGISIRLIDGGPGESYADAWFQVSSGDQIALFIGDTIMIGIPPFMQSGHSADWIESLNRLKSISAENVAIYIGHDSTPGAPAYDASIADEQIAQVKMFRQLVRDKTGGKRLLDRNEIQYVVSGMGEAFPNNNKNFSFLISSTANVVAAELMVEHQRDEFEKTIQAILKR